MSIDDPKTGDRDEPSPETFTEDMDARILRGMVADEDALLREMRERGHSAKAVRARAARLGLTGQIVRRCQLAGTLPSVRKCLACDLGFLSTGPQHRLCMRCRQVS